MSSSTDTEALEPEVGPSRRYTDAELVDAMREVLEATEFRRLSLRVYAEERRDEQPHRNTIRRRFGSWQQALEQLEGERDALAYETTPCWRCGRQRYTYESCHHCGGSCKPLTKRRQQSRDD